MTERPAWRSLLLLAWPVLVQQWLVLAVALSDRLIAGRFIDHRDASVQAAQTTAGYLAWFLASCAVLVNAGSTALVAHLIGAGDRRTASVVLHQSLLLAALLGIVGAVAGLCWLRPLLTLLRLGPGATGPAADYLLPLLLVLPLHLVGMAGIACLVGAGDTRTGLFVLGGEALLNLPATWAGFWWLGFPGIAWGTACCQALASLTVLGVLSRGRAGLRLQADQLVFRAAPLGRLLRISTPAAIDSLSMQAGHLWFLSIVNSLGDVASAAHGIALNWEAMGYQTGAAFGVATMALVGHSLGAGRPDRAARMGWLGFLLGGSAMCVMGAVFCLLADPMFRLFCPHPAQANIVAAGVPVLRLVAFGMPALASCLILASALRGAGDTIWPMLFTWIGFFGVRIPLAAWFVGHGWGLFGAWLAMNADLAVRGMCVLARFVSGGWKRVQV